MRPFLAFTVRQPVLATVGPAMPRRSLRRQSELAASILSEDGPAKDCIVKNISPKGAQLSLSTTEDLPPEFTLRIPGAKHRSRLVWKVGRQAGIEFIGG